MCIYEDDLFDLTVKDMDALAEEEQVTPTKMLMRVMFKPRYFDEETACGHLSMMMHMKG